MRPYIYNRLWACSIQSRSKQFEQSVKEPQAAQERYLKALLTRNAATFFGRRYGFSNIHAIEDYQRRVPLSEYEDYNPYIEKIAAGEKAVLSADPVLLFQTSSGSSGASKLIPYTHSLKREFQRGVSAWIASLFRENPELMRGCSYWSLTPPAQQSKNYGQIRVGFDDDAEYLSPLARFFYRGSSAVPPSISMITEMDTFLDYTLAHLVVARDLTLISVWSPTFLTLLMRRLSERSHEVIELLETGRLPGVKPGRRHAAEVKSILGEPAAEHAAALWPKLRLISCWTDGSSSLFVPELKRLFPGAAVQGKGLIATEAFVSLPFIPGRDPLPALDSHFLEFIEPASGRAFLAHQVQVGERYETAVTTGGGLYRYRLGDVVEVTGHVGPTPTLRFISKNNVVDLCGEKLQTEYVGGVLNSAMQEAGIKPPFCMLAPVKKDDVPAYCLFIEAGNFVQDQLKYMREYTEVKLMENFHYAHCRRLGQLAALRLFIVDSGHKTAAEVFIQEMQRRGLKLGGVKTSHLDREYGWETRFVGRYL
jgi:hypothetical protein